MKVKLFIFPFMIYFHFSYFRNEFTELGSLSRGASNVSYLSSLSVYFNLFLTHLLCFTNQTLHHHYT